MNNKKINYFLTIFYQNILRFFLMIIKFNLKVKDNKKWALYVEKENN